jgi:opacity protein-like surface antigen
MRNPWSRLICAGSLAMVLVPTAARADVTAFLGTNRTPSDRMVKGFAVGTGLLIAGFEFEYADTKEDPLKDAPQLRTYFFNGLAQTPIPIARMQFYATAGGGIYRETLNEASETNVGINLGGGVKFTLAGPLRLRFDYRVFTLRGTPLHSKPQRFYAGINLKF